MNAVPRRTLLLAALAAMRVKTDAPELAILHAWLDSWSGLGLVVVGMQRHGYDLLASDVPSPEPRFVPVGRAGADVVADAVACGAGGGVAGAEDVVRRRLLAHRRVAAMKTV